MWSTINYFLNKIIRFVLKIGPRYHIGQDVFKAVGWLPVSKRVDQIILNHVFKIKLGTSPDYMIEQFTPASSVHSYSPRFRENGCFSLTKVKCFGKKYFAYRECIIWNDLPNSIHKIQDFQIFKNSVRSHFLDLIYIYIYVFVLFYVTAFSIIFILGL